MKNKITSAGGIIALLDEPEPEVKLFSLYKLDEIVDVFWAEIAESITKIEEIYETIGFPRQDLAALVASKVYYHLGDYDTSVKFALKAGKLFDVTHSSEYVETIVSKCMDNYIKRSVDGMDAYDAEEKKYYEGLKDIADRMFQRCFAEQQYKQAIGIALEARRLDMFKEAISKSGNVAEMMNYAQKVAMALIQNRQFLHEVLRTLVDLYKDLATPDFISVCQCLIFLHDFTSVAGILEKLLNGEQRSVLMAYQIGFDLYESATQEFVQEVVKVLRHRAPLLMPSITSPSTVADNSLDSADQMVVDDDKNLTNNAASPINLSDLSDTEKALKEKLTKLSEILSGDVTIATHLQFLIRSNKTDMLVLKNTKDAVRNAILHNATVVANGFMHCGTTSDQFLRDNLEWLSRATNWSKFTATSSLGVVHKGHEKEALHLMSTYLPKDNSAGSAFSEGGGLYALGLIHVNHGGKITDYLLKQLKDATLDTVRHGGCLGLGLASLGTARQDVYDQLKFNLNQDDAVTGEAAGIAMGLVMLGTKNAGAIQEMVLYAHETQHEKILRGLAVGIALTMYGRLEEADVLIEGLTQDKDPILRWSGIYTLAMAYCGTGNNEAICKLLHVAVSDVNDDVRRAAVTSIGFILFRTPEQCPSVVSLLSESYNPHVRYGAAMALGIACAGTGLKEALSLLETMSNDPVAYVRQGALVASALILVQHNEVTCPKTATFRQLYAKVISDKHEDVMAKYGAILAQGIIDAGGRNMTVSLQSRTGHTNMVSVVGMLVFCQFWYWYPLSHFLSLAFTPTCIILLNNELKMPKLQLKSNAKPSMFAYVPPLEEKKDKAKEKVETAVLSITAKQKKKEAEKKREEGKKDDKMEVDEEKKDAEKEKGKDGKEKEEKVKDEEKKEPEPTFEMLSLPARVMKAQLRVLSLPEGSRYSPLKDVCNGGIIVLQDSTPSEREEIIETLSAGGPKLQEEDEPEPPEPFEWNDDFLKD